MRTLLLAMAAVALAAGLRAGEFELKLTVEEPAGLVRKAEPVCGGIPLPAGAFKKDQAFAVRCRSPIAGLTKYPLRSPTRFFACATRPKQ